jgi:hypothetical protein
MVFNTVVILKCSRKSGIENRFFNHSAKQVFTEHAESLVLRMQASKPLPMSQRGTRGAGSGVQPPASNLESDVILARYECETRYADIECVGHGRGPANPSADANGALCVVCEVGVGEVVGLGNAADAPNCATSFLQGLKPVIDAQRGGPSKLRIN